MHRWLRCLALATQAVVVMSAARADTLSPLLRDGVVAPAWQFLGLPQQRLPRTLFEGARVDGEPALRIVAVRSHGELVHDVPPSSPARRLSWRWRVDEANLWTDLRRRSGDDSAVKVCLWFDLQREALPLLDAELLERRRGRSGGAQPGAALCYVWDNRMAVGSLLANAHSSRTSMFVLRGDEAALGAWRAESRDIAADFQRAFGRETDRVPPLLAVSVGGDADNTGARSTAWITELVLD